MSHNSEHGKICYLEIPAADVSVSSEFYKKIFGWEIRTRGDASLAFNDSVGQVNGTWVTGRASAAPGMLTYIMVTDVANTLEKVIAEGGAVDQPRTAIGPMVIARFRDPGGNVLGLYQQD
jgi:predicted enzyme related to lactoylglutathione lyase